MSHQYYFISLLFLSNTVLTWAIKVGSILRLVPSFYIPWQLMVCKAAHRTIIGNSPGLSPPPTSGSLITVSTFFDRNHSNLTHFQLKMFSSFSHSKDYFSQFCLSKYSLGILHSDVFIEMMCIQVFSLNWSFNINISCNFLNCFWKS